MKQYLVLVDEPVMAKLSEVFKDIKFLEVEGMSLQNNHQMLVTPVVKPLLETEQPVQEEPPQEEVPEE
jgi:hypothetical protein